MINNSPKLDTLYKVETPEGVNLVFRPASPIIRSIALIIDLLAQVVIIFIAYFCTLLLASLLFFSLSLDLIGYPVGFLLILIFTIFWWYFVLFEMLYNGQSIGKRFCKLRVIHDDGTPISWSASILRNLLRAVDLLPSFTYAVGFITGLTNKEFKRLGDLAAGTLVVYIETTIDYPSIPKLPPKNSPFPLLPEEQKIILSFAERYETLSAERRLELSSLLSKHFELNDEQTEQSLYQIAQYLLGSQPADKTGNEP